TAGAWSAPFNSLALGSYTFTATAADNSDNVSGPAAPFIIAIISSQPPVITSNGGFDTATISIPENTTAVTTVHAVDPNNASITYSISGGADATKFKIVSATGALAFISAPDFEAPADSDANNSYIVQVEASDGGSADFQTITVNVSNVPGQTI